MFAFFLSSGFFLGWSLGANDASNVFGTAVGAKMIRFRTAAIYCSIFIILGAVVSGAGASHTLGKLGAVNALGGAFIVAFSAALSVYLMTLARFPVSTSQAIVGAVIGMGLLKGDKSINWSVVGGISSGWVITPVISALISFVSLFFMQNVFMQETYRPVPYQITEQAALRIDKAGVSSSELENLMGRKFQSAVRMKKALSTQISLTPKILDIVLSASRINEMEITMDKINSIDSDWISDEQKKAIEKLCGQKFMHQWQFAEALGSNSPFWQFREGDKKFNENLRRKLLYVYSLFEK